MTGAATAVWGPVAKEKLDRRHQRADLRDRYSPPLLQAAYDLQGRLYNIVRQRFLETYMSSGDEDLRRYAEYSTLWLLGQYLGWVEILRREVQFLDFGTSKRNRALQRALGKVTSELASDAPGTTFAVFRTSQRAIGEVMLAEPEGNDSSKRTTCLGFAEFVSRFDDDDDPAFARWFTTLQSDLEAVAQAEDYNRLIRVQRALIDVVDQLDFDRERYPVLDSRGKLPLPSPEQRRVEWDGCEQLASFVARGPEYGWTEPEFPESLLAEWAAQHELQALSVNDDELWSFSSKYRRLRARVLVHIGYREGRMEIFGAAAPPDWVQAIGFARFPLPLTSGGSRFAKSRRQARVVVNDLLESLGRPSVKP